MLPRCLAVILVDCITACAPTSNEQSTHSANDAQTQIDDPFTASTSRQKLEDTAGRHQESGAKHSSEPPISGNAVELGDWCAEHGIEASLNVERCVTTTLGPRPDDMLWCSRREELDDNRVIYYLALYRAQAKKLQKLVELSYATGPRPMEGRENDSNYYVKLAIIVADDGKSFEVKDEAGLSCEDGIKRVHDDFSFNPSQERTLAQLVTRVCSVRGKYSAAGQRISRP